MRFAPKVALCQQAARIEGFVRTGKTDVSRIGAAKIRAARPLATGAVLSLLLLVAGCDRARLDENLCPRDESPGRTTILVLDTSDPLTTKHRSELKRLVEELQTTRAAAELRVAPTEALVAYELTEDLDALEPVLKVCNPGQRPDEWGWQQELTQGKQIALRQWRRFQEVVETLFDEAQTDTPRSRSPIIEMLGVIVPRHAPSRRIAASADRPRTHVILFSDLLQHSPALSHYGDYPPPTALRSTSGLRSLQTDLTGVDVSLFRLERSRARDARWQTRDHYYWWTQLVRSFGGRVVWQESI